MLVLSHDLGDLRVTHLGFLKVGNFNCSYSEHILSECSMVSIMLKFHLMRPPYI